MRKTISIIFSIALIASVAACGGKNDNESETNTSASVTSVKTETNSKPEAENIDLKAIVEKARKEGANWTVDQWKEQFRNCLIAYKPFAIAMNEMTDRIVTDPNLDPEAEADKLNQQFPNYMELLNEFSRIANSTKNGKIVADDEQWGKAVTEELGIPDL